MKKILYLFALIAFSPYAFAVAPDIRISDDSGNVLNINSDGTVPVSGGGWDNPATEDLDMDGYDINNVGNLNTGSLSVSDGAFTGDTYQTYFKVDEANKMFKFGDTDDSLTACVALDSNRLFGDTDCNGTKGGGENYLDSATGSGSGDVVGPASSTDNAITRFDTTTGKLVQNSNWLIDDTGHMRMGGAAPTATEVVRFDKNFSSATNNLTGFYINNANDSSGSQFGVWAIVNDNNASAASTSNMALRGYATKYGAGANSGTLRGVYGGGWINAGSLTRFYGGYFDVAGGGVEPTYEYGLGVAGKARFIPQDVSVADNGGGTRASGTITVNASVVQVTCNDSDGCDMTLSETGVEDGVDIVVTNISANPIYFSDSSGVQELTGGEAIKLLQWDSTKFFYSDDRWTSDYVSPRITSRCINVDPGSSTTDWLFFKASKDLTVSKINCLVDASTSVVMTPRKCNADGASCSDIEAAITCGTTNTTESSGVDSPSISAGNWVRVTRGTVTGSPTQASLCLEVS